MFIIGFILINLALLMVEYFSGKEIYQELYQTKDNKEIFQKIAPIFFTMMILSISIFSAFDYFNYASHALIFSLSVNMFIISMITDIQTHRINRHSLRFVYAFTLWELLNKGNSAYQIAVIVTTVILLFLLFYDLKTGASDYRALYITLLISLYYMGIYGLFLTIFIVVLAAVIIMIQQRKAKFAINVPIGPWFLFGGPLSIILGLSFDLVLVKFLIF